MSAKSLGFVSQTTAPATEPLTLSEVKDFLRVDGNSEDSLITRMIAAARQAAERYTGRSFITQEWRLRFDEYMPSQAVLPRGEVQSIDTVRLVHKDTTVTIVDTDIYYLSSDNYTLKAKVPLMAHAVEIDYTAGFGDASDVPESIKQGMLNHIANMYEKRSGNTIMPAATKDGYQPYRRIMI